MEKEPGELAIVGMRSTVKAKSSAVNGRPSWNTTPGRSLNSHTSSAIVRQLSARSGASFELAWVAVSAPNTIELNAVLGEML